jgi:hypothetical protein
MGSFLLLLIYAFVVLLAAAAAVRPPLALVGDRHPNSHVTDENAG